MENRTSARVKEILGWYSSENTGILRNLSLLLNSGTLAGTGKMVILPVDQGFEHGPARSFAPNPNGYDPAYHFDLALESGCNAYAAPYGQLAAAHSSYAGQIPVILKMNNNECLFPTKNPVPAVTCSVEEALKLGAAAVGFTIYPGSSYKKDMYEEIAQISEEARACGLPVVIWSYPRGEGISKEGETAIDVVAYAAQIAAQLGAHIIKVKPPTEHIELAEAKKAYDKAEVPISTLADRVKHIIHSSFNGKRIVIFSGGSAKGDDEVLEEIKGLHAGGAFGSIMGRNAFQREKTHAIKLLQQVMAVYKG